jgi:TolA-binding protein
MQKKEYDEAKRLIRQLLNVQTPEEILSRLVFLQGEIAAENNEWSSVTESMRELIGQTDAPALRAKSKYWLAESLYRQEEYSEASELFSGLLNQIDDLDESLAPWIYLRAAQCCGQLDHWGEAKSLATTAGKLYPGFPASHEYDFIIGRALAEKGKFSNAIVAFQRVVESPTGGSSETAAIAQWRIGECYFHQEKFEKAIRAYYRVDAVFAYEKWRAASLMQAGKCQEHLGNWKHAAKLYQQLLANFPTSELCQAAEQRLALASRRAKNEVESEGSISR